MKILSLHVDYINFKPLKKALKKIGALSETDKKGKKEGESLVVLTAVEAGDSVKKSAKELVKNVEDIAGQVKTKNIVLYPYAHLSNSLASPEVAVGVLDKAEKELKKKYSVTKAPFGYYKEFEMKVKGHPLSELSREIKFEGEEEVDSRNLLRSMGKNILDRSKLKIYDHRIIGQDMDLFSFNEVAPGSVFWHHNGFIIYKELEKFMRDLLRRFEYQEISTPIVIGNKLWKVSGHWGHYKEHMFLTSYENRDAAVKPMNCPGAMLVYRTRPRSYKELPLRLSEMGINHRKELSGVLAGLFRVVKMTMDDAHIFCTKDQLETEVQNLFKLVKIIYKDTFGFDYSVELSTRPEKFMGDKKDWDYAEKTLGNALKKSRIKYKVSKGEGAFYGPKIDIHIKDSLGRNWQMSTIQLDMQMPQRFDLKYTGKDNKEHTPLVIHRAVLGTLERFIGILLEHTKGRLPTWLAPTQVKVLSFTNRNEKYARKIAKELEEKIPELRIDVDIRSTTIPTKVKDAEIAKVPYIVVVGDKEEKQKSVALRIRGNKKIKHVKISTFVKSLKKEIDEKK